MYLPSAFQESRLHVLHAFIQTYSFATLVTTHPDTTASHLPFLLDPTRGKFGTLRGHLARANPQWHSFASPTDALAIFTGPHAYISPSWYQTQPSVPTWNFTTVHATGQPQLLTDPAAVRTLLRDLVNTYESPLPTPWKMESLPEDYLAKMEAQIVCFEMEITRLQGKFKLNQNRSPADRQSVIEALNETGHADNLALAKLMKP